MKTFALLLALALAGCSSEVGKALECAMNPHTPECGFEE